MDLISVYSRGNFTPLPRQNSSEHWAQCPMSYEMYHSGWWEQDLFIPGSIGVLRKALSTPFVSFGQLYHIHTLISTQLKRPSTNLPELACFYLFIYLIYSLHFLNVVSLIIKCPDYNFGSKMSSLFFKWYFPDPENTRDTLE